MLRPKRVLYRKPHRGNLGGRASRGNVLSFGTYGIQATQASRLSSRQIEASRRVLTRYVRRVGKLWVRVFPDKAITNRPSDTRIGSGKGNPEYWVAIIRPEIIIFEMYGISEPLARQATLVAASKLPVKVQFVAKSSLFYF
jgi:large subunit ribosomal protein L16